MSAEQVSSSSSAPKAGKAQVKYGVNVRSIPAGKTVGEIKKEFTASFKIPEEAKGYSGTQQLSDDTVVTADMNLEFIRKTGEKG